MTPNTRQALAQKTQELELVQKLDQIRDRLNEDGNPQEMFEGFLQMLTDAFQAEACAILILAETSLETELLACRGMPESLAETLCRAALENSEIQPVPDSPWAHTVGIPIVLDDYAMGACVLARQNEVFSDAERERLALVESQLDSAVIQARSIWKLSQRNRELEAIYTIDRLRDRTSSESELISGFTGVLLSYFQAELCVIALTQIDTSDVLVRGLVDKVDISGTALDEIKRQCRQISIPQVIPSPSDLPDLVLLAAPFVVAGARLGAVVAGRRKSFTLGDHRLMHAIMTQMDSAVVHSRIVAQLSQRKKELEIIYKIDRIRDREKDLDAMLQAVLVELTEAVPSEIGFIALYNEGQEQELQVQALTNESDLDQAVYGDMIQTISRQALRNGGMVFANEQSGAIRSHLAIPLILNDRVIGVFGLMNSAASRGFDGDDRSMLQAITSQVDTAIFERLEQRRMRAILSRSVDPKVVEHLLSRANLNILSGERVNLSVLFADLRGSTEWAERTQPEEFVSTLNMFLGRMTDIIFEHGGTLDKFVGDQVIGLFGTPVHQEDHAYRAAAAAAQMRAAHLELQAKLSDQGRELPPLGIGVSSGEAIAGEIGHRIRSEFTALGRIVNLGSRLCSAAEADQILLSEITFTMTERLIQVNPLGLQTFKGINTPCAVYELVSVRR
ncbi:MAG: GAF domain-containing protein [Anaerolineae bacterium]|nr:GAF domain-containing protein [Anaerolineae bacterium]